MADAPDDIGQAAGPSVDEFLGTNPGGSWRRWIRWLSIGLAAVVLIVLVGRFVNGGLATEYATEPVARVDIPLKLFGGGRLQPVAVHMVDTGQQGVIRDVAVEDGQPVSKGDILARLDPAPFREAIDQARQLLDARQAALGKAQAAKEDIEGRLALYQRVRRRSGGSVPSNREMAAAQETAKRANDAVDAAQVEVASARTALNEREARLASADIRAPIAGVIARRFVAVGQSIGGTPGRHLFAIAEPYSRLRLEIATDRAQALRLREAHPTRAIVTTASGKAIAAPILRVTETAAPPSPARSLPKPAAADTVPVGITLELGNPGAALRVGTTVTVQLDLGLRRDVLVVPDSALHFGRASDAARAPGEVHGEAVYVTGSDGTPERIPVTRGGSDGRKSEVASDMLKPGMRVITGLR
ncbi:biotin/lipoyl-binding protein [Sphingomonas sp. CL5.1]|uniref:efflux RND transporter periplasmic adaptor subunit n=1 Tax=Sphingomonas sp. CL5.1 TaxID=2653203 RepID=UPI0015814845|nr:biotin/lipoyl-binding protein [Sphingomonas sp. CL5.1]QKS00540.1 biotin/lipoyl-binding protein [Sphingomonas sp. CL5.1]